MIISKHEKKVIDIIQYSFMIKISEQIIEVT
jgi:hypothetical protein